VELGLVILTPGGAATYATARLNPSTCNHR